MSTFLPVFAFHHSIFSFASIMYLLSVELFFVFVGGEGSRDTSRVISVSVYVKVMDILVVISIMVLCAAINELFFFIHVSEDVFVQMFSCNMAQNVSCNIELYAEFLKNVYCIIASFVYSIVFWCIPSYTTSLCICTIFK